MKGSPEGAYHKKPFFSIALAGTESSYRTYSSPIINITFDTLCKILVTSATIGRVSYLVTAKIILFKDVFPMIQSLINAC